MKICCARRFIGTLKNKVYKCMASISKNASIDKIDDVVNKYNKAYHRTIKMKTVDVNPSMYINFNKESNDKDLKFKIDDIVRISKEKNVFVKGYVPNWSKEVFVTTKFKNTIPWTYVIIDLKGEKNFGTFYKKELQKTNQKEFRVEKVIKRKAINDILNGKAMITF